MSNKEAVQDLLRKMEINSWVKNLQIMGEKLYLDLYSPSPTMHEKKRIEQAVKNAFKQELPSLELHLKLHNQEQPKDPEIKGKQIPGIKHIVAVASGKGGVGKSTITANLAMSLHKMGFKVGVLDADIYGPSMPTMFDVVDEKPLSVEVNGKNKMKPVESYGIKMLSIGFFAKSNQAVVWRGPMASKALNQMIHDADWGELDFLLIDLPPGTGDIHLSIVQQLPITGAVIVSTPQEIALADARKGVDMFKMDAINVPVLGIVENMAYFTPAELPDNKYYIFGKNGVRNWTLQNQIPFLGEIPLIQSIREAADAGRPAALQEDTAVAQIYTEVAQQVVQNLSERVENLPPTEVVRITTMAGCSAVKK